MKIIFLDLISIQSVNRYPILLKLVSKPRTGICASNWLVKYWELCIEKRDCHYKTSLIGYWGKGSIVGWYKVLGFLYL